MTSLRWDPHHSGQVALLTSRPGSNRHVLGYDLETVASGSPTWTLGTAVRARLGSTRSTPLPTWLHASGGAADGLVDVGFVTDQREVVLAAATSGELFRWYRRTPAYTGEMFRR